MVHGASLAITDIQFNNHSLGCERTNLYLPSLMLLQYIMPVTQLEYLVATPGHSLMQGVMSNLVVASHCKSPAVTHGQ